MAIRVVFMGTPEFAVPSLERLIAGTEFDVVAVVTQPDRPAGRGRRPMASPVKQVAQAHGIPLLTPHRLRDNPEAIQSLYDAAPDAIVVAAYGQILPPAVLEIPPHGCVNVHASLLPRYRGAAPVAAAILNGDAETGVTIMLMDEKMDHGPILAQRAIPIRSDDTQATLTQRLAQLGADLLVETLPRWVAGEIEPRPQDHEQATYAYLIKKEDGRIDWTQPAVRIERMTRAYDPWPGAWTTFKGQVFKIIRAKVLDVEPTAEPGRVVETPHGLAVATGDGMLLLETVQLAGKRAMSAVEFARGHRDFVGAVLGTSNAASAN
jgi:methionyl-tRNA formyltransferase